MFSGPLPLCRFSHDRGACFVKQQLDSTSVFSLTRGLLMDPSAASRFAFVMGVEGVGSSDTWRMISLNFGTLLRTKCELSLVCVSVLQPEHHTNSLSPPTSLPPLLPLLTLHRSTKRLSSGNRACYSKLLSARVQERLQPYQIIIHVSAAFGCFVLPQVYITTPPSFLFPSLSCYNEKGYNYSPVQQNRCSCDYTDYEW